MQHNWVSKRKQLSCRTPKFLESPKYTWCKIHFKKITDLQVVKARYLICEERQKEWNIFWKAKLKILERYTVGVDIHLETAGGKWLQQSSMASYWVLLEWNDLRALAANSVVLKWTTKALYKLNSGKWRGSQLCELGDHNNQKEGKRLSFVHQNKLHTIKSVPSSPKIKSLKWADEGSLMISSWRNKGRSECSRM